MVIIYHRGAEILRPAVREEDQSEWIRTFNQLPEVGDLHLQAWAVSSNSVRPLEVLDQLKEKLGVVRIVG